MAFKMNRPIIKGTSLHKASVAKATSQSIVSQRRTRSDASLVSAAEALGQSYTPQAIDFSIKMPEINIPEKEKPTDADKKTRNNKRQERKERRKRKKLDKRLEKAMEGGEDSDYDFSQIEAEPSRKKIKEEPYASPEASTEYAEELLKRTQAKRNKALQEAAKKYNVKIKDLEAKEIGGKREFFPKQNVVGGKDATQWDDKLGRFRKPEAKLLTKEDEKIAIQEMKPKFPEGMDPNLAKTGEIKLNYDTNTYEYTQQYYDRLAREKIEQKKAKTTSITTKPVVEKKKTTTSNARQRRLDKKYENAGPNVRANMIADGYVPSSGLKSSMQMRDDRIYRNAIKGGPVRKNMIKGGYIPQNER